MFCFVRLAVALCLWFLFGATSPCAAFDQGAGSDLGAAAAPAGTSDQGPDAAPASPGGIPQTGPISGYMDFHFNHPTDGALPVLDFHRFVLLFTHRFSDRIRFVSEVEIEHAFVEGLEQSGELAIEQAYLDFLLRPSLNFRAGMLLVPVGIINERHEPPVYHGVERPFVDTFIVPTTWFDAGAGIHGAFGKGFRYRTYLMAPLDATEFTAGGGISGSAQHGSEAQVRNVALTGRLEHVGVRGLQTGVSFWSGETAFRLPRIHTKVRLYEGDARLTRDRLETRAQYAHMFIDGAGALNDAIGRRSGVDPHVAEQLRGFYVEGSYRVLPSSLPHDAALFVRYENFDTQYRMPAGSTKLPQFDRDAWVVGATYWPDPDVAIKVDYSYVRSGSRVVPPPRSFNVGLGWWF